MVRRSAPPAVPRRPRLGRIAASGHRRGAADDLGAWLASEGRDEDAAPHLGAARATYAEVGATSWLERLDAAALLTGSPARK